MWAFTSGTGHSGLEACSHWCSTHHCSPSPFYWWAVFQCTVTPLTRKCIGRSRFTAAVDVCVHVCGPCSSLWCDRDPRVDSSKSGCAPLDPNLRFWVFPRLHKDLSVRLSGRVHSGGCEVISPVAWLCISPMTNAVGLLLSFVLSYSTSLGKWLFKSLVFFQLYHLPFCYWILSALYIFWRPALYQTHDLQTPFPLELCLVFAFDWWHLLKETF